MEKEIRMDLLGFKWTKEKSDFEITVVEKINDLEHYEMAYKDAFNVQCAKMEFNEELFSNCEHKTDECKDFYFCIVEETQKDVVLEKPVITDDMNEFEKNMILALPEVLYGKNIIHLLINKSGCFRFTADNQKYINTDALKADAEAEYAKMLIALANLIDDETQGENRVVQKNGTLAIEHVTERELTVEKIAVLKQRLNDTDYKVTANQECAQARVEYLHDPEVLHAERQAIRDEINALEKTLK